MSELGDSMKKLLALTASLLLIASFATPAQAAGAKYKVYQKTLSAFSSTATTLTSQQKAQVKAAVEANPDAEKFVCTGIRYFSQPMSINIMVRKRAKAACEYAKELNPNLSTWFQNKPTQARSYAGKVLLTVKTPEGSGAGGNSSSETAESSGNYRTGFAFDNPDVWLTSYAKKAGHLCRVEGERIVVKGNNKGLECRRESMSTFRWVEIPYLEQYSTTPNPENPVAGTKCFRQGDQVQNAGGYLECRYVAGMQLQFVQLTGSNDAPKNAVGLSSVEMCKIQDARPYPLGGGVVAFPMRYNRMQTNGVVDVAIVPIDYPDAVASGKPAEWLQIHLDMLDQRNRDLFGNRIQYRWHIPDNWLRMPMTAKNYNQDHATVQADGSRKLDGTETLRTRDEQLTEIFTEAEKVLDIEQMDFFWIFSNPYAEDVPFPPGYYQDITTATKTYKDVSAYGLGFWTYNSHTVYPAPAKFEGFAHEMQHAHGLIQHAPGNGWAWFEGTNPTWESWLAGWRPDSEFACLDGTKPVDTAVSLSSMDLTSSGFKSLVIKVSATEVLVVESRRNGLYTRAIPKGFAGITVYNVNATKLGERWDGNLEKEQDYFAYFLRNNRGTYPNPKQFGPFLGDENVIAYQGDSFTYRGITITLESSGDYDTVKISSATGATPMSNVDREKYVIVETFGREPENNNFCGCCGCFPGANLH